MEKWIEKMIDDCWYVRDDEKKLRWSKKMIQKMIESGAFVVDEADKLRWSAERMEKWIKKMIESGAFVVDEADKLRWSAQRMKKWIKKMIESGALVVDEAGELRWSAQMWKKMVDSGAFVRDGSGHCISQQMLEKLVATGSFEIKNGNLKHTATTKAKTLATKFRNGSYVKDNEGKTRQGPLSQAPEDVLRRENTKRRVRNHRSKWWTRRYGAKPSESEALASIFNTDGVPNFNQAPAELFGELCKFTETLSKGIVAVTHKGRVKEWNSLSTRGSRSVKGLGEGKLKKLLSKFFLGPGKDAAE
jgi:anti-sigma28 factor (negative regulator of flagellin synthesis)